MAKFEKEVYDNAILFEVLDMNGAPVLVGDVVEFDGYYGANDRTIICAQTETACNQWIDFVYEPGTTWFYEKKHLRALTPLAQEVLDGLDD